MIFILALTFWSWSDMCENSCWRVRELTLTRGTIFSCIASAFVFVNLRADFSLTESLTILWITDKSERLLIGSKKISASRKRFHTNLQNCNLSASCSLAHDSVGMTCDTYLSIFRKIWRKFVKYWVYQCCFINSRYNVNDLHGLTI